MKDSNLLASVALFSELYNNEKYNNISDIISEFIKGAIFTEKKWTVNSTELTLLLSKVYDFKIPESVVKTTIRNRMKEMVVQKGGWYHFDSSLIKSDYEEMSKEYHKITSIQARILDHLYEYIEESNSLILTAIEQEKVRDDFGKYLFDNGASDVYSQFISEFVIKNKDNLSFMNNLNLIREGLILYQGICYTSDINEMGNWTTELKIFLSTEHLFNAVGFNGSVYKQIFNDFYELVIRINQKSRNRHGDKLIELKYFEETQKEVDDFFQTAELIKRGTIILDPSKSAMREILSGCRSPSDIKAKQVKFYEEIRQLGISEQQFSKSVYSYPDYIVEDETVIEELKRQSTEKRKLFNEVEYRKICRIYTKINYYRGGESKMQFEKIGHIFLTANRFSLWIGHHTRVKFKERDIPFATDIDFITSKFWFKLRKGFGDKCELPKSFDVVTKAQIVLSTQVNSAISRRFDELKLAYNEGKLTKEQALNLSYDLREKSTMPEDIDVGSIDESIDFLKEENYIEYYFREKDLKEQQFHELQENNMKLLNELNQHKNEKLLNEQIVKETRRKDDEQKFLIEREREYQENSCYYRNYFIKIIILTLCPIIVGFLIKVIKPIDIWLNSIGNWEFLVWGALSLIFLAEIVGRSYLNDKDKIKRGWVEIKYLFNNKSRRQNLKIMRDEWVIEYNRNIIRNDLIL